MAKIADRTGTSHTAVGKEHVSSFWTSQEMGGSEERPKTTKKAEEQKVRTYASIAIPWEVSFRFGLKVLTLLLFIAGEKTLKLLATNWLSLGLWSMPFSFFLNSGRLKT